MTSFVRVALVLSCVCVVAVWGDSRCTAISGSCQTDSGPCTGSYRSGLCSGPANRRCCVPAAGPNGGGDSQCTGVGGTCQQDFRRCGGGYLSGLCAGAANRRCCIPRITGGGRITTKEILQNLQEIAKLFKIIID